MFKFYLPVLYSITTRYSREGIKGLLLFSVIYLIPLIILMFCFSDIGNGWLWCLAIILVLDLYEIGYIQNDAETIKKEDNPTMRLQEKELMYYEKHKYLIYSIRILFTFFLSLLFLNYSQYSIEMLWKIGILWLLITLYLLYNSIRNVWNIILLTILTSYRVIMPMVLCTAENDSNLLLAIVYAYFTYPFPTIIQQCVMGKFGIEIGFIKKILIPDFAKRYMFRIKYYFLLTIVIAFLVIILKLNWMLIICPLYYLLMRISLQIVEKRID